MTGIRKIRDIEKAVTLSPEMQSSNVPYCSEHRVCAATGSPNPTAIAERGAAPVTPTTERMKYMRKRTSTIQLRVTAQEKKRIESNAKKCEMTLSNYLRQLASGFEPSVLPRDEIICMHQELCRVKQLLLNGNQADLLTKLNHIQQGLFALCFPDEGAKSDGNDKDLAH